MIPSTAVIGCCSMVRGAGVARRRWVVGDMSVRQPVGGTRCSTNLESNKVHLLAASLLFALVSSARTSIEMPFEGHIAQCLVVVYGKWWVSSLSSLYHRHLLLVVGFFTMYTVFWLSFCSLIVVHNTT